MSDDELNEKIISLKSMNDGRTLPELDNCKFTSNMADAWTLVEEMTEHMDEISLSVFTRLADLKKMWTFEAESYTAEENYCNVEQTAPLAIAKAYYEWRTNERA